MAEGPLGQLAEHVHVDCLCVHAWPLLQNASAFLALKHDITQPGKRRSGRGLAKSSNHVCTRINGIQQFATRKTHSPPRRGSLSDLNAEPTASTAFSNQLIGICPS
jgi:hypothetical protein